MEAMVLRASVLNAFWPSPNPKRSALHPQIPQTPLRITRNLILLLISTILVVISMILTTGVPTHKTPVVNPPPSFASKSFPGLNGHFGRLGEGGGG